MADALSALGRSGALGTISEVLDRGTRLRLEELKGGSDLLKTGLELQQFQQKSEVLELQKAAGELELEKAEKKRAFDTRPVEFSVVTNQMEKLRRIHRVLSGAIIEHELPDADLRRQGRLGREGMLDKATELRIQYMLGRVSDEGLGTEAKALEDECTLWQGVYDALSLYVQLASEAIRSVVHSPTHATLAEAHILMKLSVNLPHLILDIVSTFASTAAASTFLL